MTNSPLQQFVEQVGSSRNAGSKAVRDVTSILTRMGFESIGIYRWTSENRFASFLGRLSWVVHCPFWKRKVKQNACLIVQYTISCFHGQLTFRLVNEDLKRRRKVKIIAVVHDLNRLDPAKDAITPVERRFFALCDRVIVHNEKMRAFLVRHGVESAKLVSLQVFDYLLDGHAQYRRLHDDERRTIVIAGNLSPDKCGYLKGLSAIAGVNWRLFGLGIDPSQLGSRIAYCGSFDPDRPPDALTSGFGLIWYGDSSETCDGTLGEYSKIINPHKMSLYLAMGMPVIVWRQSAVADFVQKHHLGLAVDSLRELGEKLIMSEAEYDSFCRSVRSFSAGLRSGFFMSEAVRRCTEEVA